MEKMINIKTVAGVGAGVALGFFALKSKNFLVLMALGVAGGVLANVVIKPTVAQPTTNTKSDLAVESVEDSGSEEDSDSKSSVEGFAWNERLGRMMPYGTVNEQSPSDFMDVGF
jgi:hypothetical protein